MNNLKKLSEKLHEYNKTNSTAWALLFCTPSVDEVFIVSEVDNDLSPDWWPNNSTGETIEDALGLVPEAKRYTVEIYINDEEKTRLITFTDASREEIKGVMGIFE